MTDRTDPQLDPQADPQPDRQAETDTVPLSVIVDGLAQHGQRDEAFVRGLAAWLGERRTRLTLPLVDRLELTDVVVTFRMRGAVRLIVTGYPPDELPGEVTLTIDEGDFPFVQVRVLADERDDPYQFCTLDYAPAGRSVHVVDGPLAGQSGVLVVSATIDGREEHRVQVNGRVVTLPPQALRVHGAPTGG